MKAICKELKELKVKYTSPARMAEALRAHRGFEKVDRTTISRWFRGVSPRQAHRAALAVKILKSKQEAQIMAIGEPRTLWVLPSTMLIWPLEKGKPYGLLEKKYHVKMERVETKTGGEAIGLLNSGKVQIALAAREMIRGSGSSRLCSLAKTYLTGVGTTEIKFIQDLNTVTCGYPANSAVAERLKTIAWKAETRSFDYTKDGAQALLDRKVDVVIGWEPLISEIEEELKKTTHRKLYLIKPGLLGTIDIDIAINIRSADPSAVRKYLMSLKEAVKHIEKRKASDAFHMEISKKLGIEVGHTKSILTNSQFALDDLELETVLALWEREAYDK